MFETLDLTRMANAMAGRAGARMGVIARNVANADTPGFKAMDLPSFAETFQDSDFAMRATRVQHFGAATEAAPQPSPRQSKGADAPNGNTVSLEQEMVKMADVRQDHEMALAIYRNTTEILRTSLGRNR
jgi:flagellar basal-body rod protein FlgB